MAVKKRAEWLLRFLIINFGIILMAAGIYFFKAPNGFATGGVSGIAIILARIPFSVKLGITQATYMLAINVILLILGVILLGKKCGFMTIYCSVMLSLENMLLEHLVPLDAPLTGSPLLELVYAVLLTGIGSALLFKYQASSGGTDIVALILKKYSSLNVSQALLVTDFLIAASTFIVYDSAEVGLYSLLGLFAKVFVIDDVLDSINLCKAFTIITTKSEEIDKFILTELHHGATTYRAQGAFTGEEKQVIITVCKRGEALKLRRRVKEIDPHAFIIITKTSEIMGKGFRG
jgi:uncharacterized membrane-anchored protein YitT (DUF2179 family)